MWGIDLQGVLLEVVVVRHGSLLLSLGKSDVYKVPVWDIDIIVYT